MLHVVFREKCVVPRLGEEADGLGALRALAEAMPPERAAAIAGIEAGDIARAALLLARVRPVAALTRLGVAMSRRATVNEWLTWALVGVLGGMGRDGGMVHNPGFLDFHSMLERAPRAQGSILGVLPPVALAEAVLRDGADRLRALVVVAADSMESVPNSAKVERAWRRLDALVVLDIVATATTGLATVVLPCAHHLEKEDTFLTLPDRLPLRRAGLSRPAAAPPEGARSEVAILADLAKRLGVPLFGARPVDLAVRAASMLHREPGAAMTPAGAMEIALPLVSRFGLTRRRLSRGVFGKSGGRLGGEDLRRGVRRQDHRIDLAPVAFVEAARAIVEGRDGPPGGLVLSTCTRSRESIKGKMRILGHGPDRMVVRLSPADAADLGCATGSRVAIETRTGSVEAEVLVDEDLRAGAAAVYFGTPGLNRITDDEDRDPFSPIPALANVPCRITPLAGGGA
jgi:anaerobic selenocysteine-containing dehydrogenase